MAGVTQTVSPLVNSMEAAPRSGRTAPSRGITGASVGQPRMAATHWKVSLTWGSSRSSRRITSRSKWRPLAVLMLTR